MDVNQQIRAVIKDEMKSQELTQVELAKRLGIKPPSLNQVMTGERGRIPPSLLTVLDALGLELVAQPKRDGQK